jgi:acetoin utilization protein AcuC
MPGFRKNSVRKSKIQNRKSKIETVLAPFHFHPRMLAYDFGPGHPLKPERMRRTVRLLEALGHRDLIDPGPGQPEHALTVHTPDYVEAVRLIDEAVSRGEEAEALRRPYGFYGDTPPFPGIYDASLAYTAGSVATAEAVVLGTPVAFGMAGGLHHALPAKAAGFCVFNDAAVACHILRQRFDRVAYVDIDVHHGDGVQWIFYEDPSVLTCSIHEDGSTLFPGTGGVDETGAEWTSFNVPLPAKTTGDVWLDAFERAILPALEAFAPEAVVLQMGTDSHFDDPLGHLLVSQQEWLAAVRHIRDLRLPTVALGGGGYNLQTVPRMWVSAVLTLSDEEFEDRLPDELAQEWGVETFSDRNPPGPRGGGRACADAVVERLLRENVASLAARGER